MAICAGGPAGRSAAAAVPLTRFVEKPDLATAQAMLADGGTCGIRASSSLPHANRGRLRGPCPRPDGAGARRGRQGRGRPGLPAARSGRLGAVDDISIDYAVMERAANIAAVPYRAAGPTWAAGRDLAASATGRKRRGPPSGRSRRWTAATRCCARNRRGWNWSGWGWRT